MSYTIQIHKIAREMRLSGKSLSEIHKETQISIPTLSAWFSDITLTNEQISQMNSRVAPKISRGRMNSSINLKAKRMFKERRLIEDSEREFKLFLKDPFFISGISLYWAHGSTKSKHFQFTSSDIEMINLMEKWIIKFLMVEKSLIKKKEYGGYLRIVITRIDVQRRVIAWQKLLIKYYSEVLV